MIKDKTDINGCFHIHVENGKIKNVFSHMDDFPKNCVIHMLPEKVYTYEEFEESHDFDKDELQIPHLGKIYDLKGDSIVMEDKEVKIQTLVDLKNNIDFRKNK